MSKFTSANRINTRWRGNDFVGAPGSSHTFPNELHDEFLVDWAYPIQIGDITITETPTTGNIQAATITVGDLVLTGTATGSFGQAVLAGTSPINVVTASGTSTVSLNASYQTAGTYVTSVAGTAPVSASTTTAGAATVSVSTGVTSATVALGSHLHTGVYQDVGSYAATVHTHATSSITSGNFAATVTGGTGVTVTGGTGNASAPSVAIGQPVGVGDTVTFAGVGLTGYLSHATQLTFSAGGVPAASVLSTGLYLPPSKTVKFEGTTEDTFETDLTVVDPTADRTITFPDATGTVALTNSEFTTIANATGTATTITSTTAATPTDISGLTFTFTPTYNEDVFVQANLVVTQSASPASSVDIIGKITVNGTQASQFSYYRLTASHSSPSGWTQGQAHTFAATSGTSYTVKVSAYKSSANGTYAASNGSTFSIIRVRA